MTRQVTSHTYRKLQVIYVFCGVKWDSVGLLPSYVCSGIIINRRDLIGYRFLTKSFNLQKGFMMNQKMIVVLL